MNFLIAKLMDAQMACLLVHFLIVLLLVAAFSDAEELSFYGTPRNDSRRCLESTSNTLGRSHR
jgi:hypothetical protein